MMQRCVVALIIYFASISTVNAQSSPPLEGQWLGTLTQEHGGYRESYSFEIYLVKKGDVYDGRTYVYAPNVLGVLSFEAKKRGAVLYVQEKELIISRKPSDLSWCFKTMQLRMVQRSGEWYLEGPWQGSSDYGVCIPGWLSLKRIPPQA